ncbi:MAG TPA: polysaccharide biosynthesis C-terminal domain-containing protein [Candidatus Brocadiia bacterium]|nr:polysaccharide biosynthesis C-terminal domain-containing protein [Candidatus Brocadiia bacterium]
MPNLIREFLSGARTVKFDAVRIGVCQIAALGVSILTGAVLARSLNVGDMGKVDLFVNLSGLLGEIAFLGVGSGLLYHLANRKVELSRIHATGLLLVALLSVGALALGAATMPLWAGRFAGLSRGFVIAALALTPFLLYQSLWQNLMPGINEAPRFYLVNLAVAAAGLGALIILVFGGPFDAGRAMIWRAGICLAGPLVGFFIIASKHKGWRIDAGLAKNVLRYGIFIYVGTFANAFHMRLDQLMINARFGPADGNAQVALYTRGLRVAEMILIVTGAMAVAALHKIASQNPDEARRLAHKLFWPLLGLLILGAAPLALIAPWLMGLIYGKAYVVSGEVLRSLLPGMLLWGTCQIMSNVLAYNLGKPHLCATAAVIGLLVNYAVNSLLIPSGGIIGAAWARTISFAVVTVFIIACVEWLGHRRGTGVPNPSADRVTSSGHDDGKT